MRRRRLRGLALAATAIACGAAASSHVSAREGELEARVGRPVAVLVARDDLRAGARIRARSVDRLFERRLVPEAFAPPDALSLAADAAGLRTAVPVSAGAYLTASLLATPAAERGTGAPLRSGERAVELTVAGGEDVLAAAGGTRVDVLVTHEGRDGGGRTEVALEDAELLAVRRADEASLEAAGRADGRSLAAALQATLRVSVDDAVYLTAADSFAREIRLLVRARGDRRPVGGLSAALGAGGPP